MKALKKFTFILCIATCLLSCSKNDEDSGDCTLCSYTKTANETAGTVASSLDGKYELTMHHADAKSPFADGTKANFTISKNVLTVEISGEECMTLKNPILTTAGSTEVKFKDTCNKNITYDVSMTPSGELNEINISDLNGTWLGQFNDR